MARVLTYGLSSNRGGIETALLRVASNMGTEEHELHYVESAMNPAAVSGELRALGHTVHRVADRRSGLGRNRMDWERLLDNIEPDVLHMHINTMSYVLPARLALARDVGVILHSRSSGSPPSRTRTRVMGQLNARSFPMDRVTRVAVSRVAGSWLFGHRDFEVLHNGVELDKHAFDVGARVATRAALGLGDSFVVAQIGVLGPVKNQQFSLDVFARLLGSVPNARFVLVGSGAGERALREKARALGVEEHTMFLGARRDVADIMSASDALLLPSLYEGFPNVALEAQASGLSTLVSNAVTDEVEISSHLKRLPLAGGPDPWVRSLIAVLETSALCDRTRVSPRLKNEFSPQAEASRYSDLYRRVGVE